MIDAALSDVFECPVEAIGETYQHFFTVWLKSAAIQSNLALPVFEEYPEGTSRRPVCIHVPIREQHEQGAGPRPVQSLTSKGLLKQVHGLLQRVQARHFLRNGPLKEQSDGRDPLRCAGAFLEGSFGIAALAGKDQQLIEYFPSVPAHGP